MVPAQVIRTMARKHGMPMFQVAIVAVDKNCRVGASCSFQTWTDDITGELHHGSR